MLLVHSILVFHTLLWIVSSIKFVESLLSQSVSTQHPCFFVSLVLASQENNVGKSDISHRAVYPMISLYAEYCSAEEYQITCSKVSPSSSMVRGTCLAVRMQIVEDFGPSPD